MPFCTNALTWEPLSELLHVRYINGDAGILMVVLSFVYLLNTGVTIYWIKLQERKARQGNIGAARNVVFPVFVLFLWASSVTDLFIALVVIFVKIDPLNDSSWQGSILFALSFSLQHVVIEGITFLLMQYGCGVKAAVRALGWASLWGAATFVMQLFTYKRPNDATGVLLQVMWTNIQIVFYAALWLLPSTALFRRPAAIFYSKFLFGFRVTALIAFLLRFVIPQTESAGGCIYVFGPLLIFSITKPYVVYLTLLRDSDWWQGLNVTDAGDEEAQLRKPLLGVDLPLDHAQNLAESIDQLKHAVRRINFAYITLDRVLGEGSSSRVYKGSYKGRDCAVKLLFTLDLTPNHSQMLHRSNDFE